VSGIPTNITTLALAGSSQSGAVAFFVLLTIATLIACIIFTDAHRLVPLTYANQGAGRGVQGNIPIRLNQAGMVPIIFAVSLITLPSIIAQFLATAPRFQWLVTIITTHFNPAAPRWGYIVLYFLLVLLFNYFYVSVTFKPADLAESIQKRGGFIPGTRPGQQTASMLEQISNRLNLWGGLFLALIAVIPLMFSMFTQLPSSDMLLSGSGLIILVGVVMELIRQVNASMLAHDYEKLV
jgi:preprotein translocase subunit SecY